MFNDNYEPYAQTAPETYSDRPSPAEWPIACNRRILTELLLQQWTRGTDFDLTAMLQGLATVNMPDTTDPVLAPEEITMIQTRRPAQGHIPQAFDVFAEPGGRAPRR